MTDKTEDSNFPIPEAIAVVLTFVGMLIWAAYIINDLPQKEASPPCTASQNTDCQEQKTTANALH